MNCGYLLNTIAWVLIIMSSQKLKGQNLVPNPGFDLVNTCITSTNTEALNALENWFAPDESANSPDVYNACFGVPSYSPQSLYFSLTTPRSGDGMIGLGTSGKDQFRELISVKLNENLLFDSAYCISFYVKNSNLDDLSSWSQNLSMYFSSDSLDLNEMNQIVGDIKPQQQLDGEDWIEIHGFIIATGNEAIINIGFFGSADVYHPFQSPNDPIYYFIDDVSITLCNKDSLIKTVIELPNVFTPNDDNVNDTYKLIFNNIDALHIMIFNRWGNVVLEYDGLNFIWDGLDSHNKPLVDGVYYVKAIVFPKYEEQFVLHQFVHLIR